MYSHKFTRKDEHNVLAVCDEELLGDEISGEKITIEIKEEFYGEEPISEEELLEKAAESTIINAVGNEVVELLIENGFFEKGKILEIDGINHAQMVQI